VIEIEFVLDDLLHKPHQEVFVSPARFKVISAGRRWGKSYLGSFLLLKAAYETPNGIFWFISPTQSMSRTIIWDVLKEKVIPELVRNINESRLEIELINGAKITLKSAEKYDNLRGASLSAVIFDEVASMRNFAEIWQKSIRPALSDRLGFAIFISSPAGRNHFFDLYNRAKQLENWDSWQFTTASGGYVLESEIEAARADMDAQAFRQEYYATFESFQGVIVKDFNRDTHIEHDFILQPHEHIFMGCDLNVNIMPAALAVIRNDTVIFFDEFYGNLDTPELIRDVRLKYPDRAISVFPDNSAGQRSSLRADTSSLQLFKENFTRVFTKTKNPRIMDRIHSFNHMVMDANGDIRLKMTPNCKHLTESCEKHTYADDGLPDKKSGYDHMFDGASYFISYKFPIKRTYAKIIKMKL